MSSRIPPPEPFDTQERELARILAALPGGEPPPHLDASILRAAANAAAASRRPHARWLASAGALWGIGGAAAGVLALGVAWQMRYPARDSTLSDSAPAAAMSNEAEDSSIPIEFKERAPEQAGNAAPPPALAKDPSVRRVRSRQAVPAAPQSRAPEPFSADQLDEHAANRAEAGGRAESDFAAPSPAPLAIDAQSSRAYAAKAAVADAASAVAAEAQTERADQGRSVVAGASAGALSASPDTRRMKPANWLAQIRALRDAGHRQEAHASLVLFHREHPQYVIPSDLAPLLRE